MSKMLRRVLTVIPAAAVQALWILLLVKWLSPYAAYITLALSVAAVLLVLFIIIKRDETAYKILWLLVILTVPVAGALLYLLFGNRRTARPLRKRLRRVQEAGQPAPRTVQKPSTICRPEKDFLKNASLWQFRLPVEPERK